MTLIEATEKAKLESKNGYVQHVNCDIYYNQDGTITHNYVVSDWYDNSTVISFENGREL